MSTISASTTSTTAYKVTADTTGALVLQTGATPTTAVTIDTSQNVGIGTSSPSSYGLLSVVSSTAGSAKISIQDTSGGASPAPLVQFGVNSSNGFNTSDAARVWTTAPSSSTAALNFAAYNGGAPSTAQMTLTGGNVGINGTPTYKLDVGINNQTQSTTVGSNGLIRNATGADQSPFTQARIIVYGGTGVDVTNWGYLAYGSDASMRIIYAKTGAGGPLIFGTTSALDGTGAVTEQARLTSAGLLQFNSGYGSVATAYGCRAWVNFNGTGTVAINASGNVSSITDNGTGEYTVNMTTAMPDINYVINATANANYGTASGFMNINTTTASFTEVAPTTSAFRVQTVNRVNTAYDPKYVSVSVFR